MLALTDGHGRLFDTLDQGVPERRRRLLERNSKGPADLLGQRVECGVTQLAGGGRQAGPSDAGQGVSLSGIIVALVLAMLGTALTIVGPGQIGKIAALISSGLDGTIDLAAIARIGVLLSK